MLLQKKKPKFLRLGMISSNGSISSEKNMSQNTTPEEKAQIFKARNDLLKRVNEAIQQKYYLDAVLFLEDAIVMSNKIGESERAKEYNQKMTECVEKVFSLFATDDETESDIEEISSLKEERERLIHSAQESMQNRQFKEARTHYRSAMEISIKLKDKMAIWKLTKSISILGEKTTPSELLSIYSSEKQPAKEVETKRPFSAPSIPKAKPSGKESEIKRREFTIVSKPTPQSPPGKELPFFKAVIPQKESQEIEEREEAIPSPKETEKKLKKESEKKEIDRKKAEKKEAVKKKIGKKEIKKEAVKKQTKKEAVKKEIKKEVPGGGLSSDVLAEIKGFKHEELSSSPSQSTTAAPKKKTSSKSALPNDIIEELKMKRKKSE